MPKQKGHRIAEEHAQQNGGQPGDPLGVVVEDHDRRQGERGDEPVLPGAVNQASGQPTTATAVFCGAAGHIVNSRGIEG